ncbi:nuclear transport factor 2 family protein [Ekhidna sp.]|uniref:YybH family protein n=1 Tax=Ekhidna sp. TaxID=2608089 RepID=UPI0032ED5881
MKNLTKYLSPLPIILMIACEGTPDQSKIDEWKQEIMEVESEFSQMVVEEGVPAAFLAFSAEDVVLMRNNQLTIGKDALREKYSNLDPTPGTSLTWKPDFVDVSKSGDMAYTYGKYVYSQTDSLGNIKSDTGVFHTVWKRQEDGSWKFVWD